jgi:uncharacterized protein (DUF433 family)
VSFEVGPSPSSGRINKTSRRFLRGTRLTVDYILNLLAHGATEKDILMEYQGVTEEDIRACYLFAAKILKETDFMPLTVEPTK